MIKAVFFDFYNTLISFDPPREELQVVACREFGIEVDRKAIPRGYWFADDFMSRENARSPIHKRSQADELAFWSDYEAIILRKAGVDISKDLALRIFTRARQLDRRLVLFDDALPIIRTLRSRGIVLGLVSNLSRALDGHVKELGLTPYIDFALTSSEIGAEKPHSPIFLAALERAGVAASEAIHVGDQYHSDVVGAKGVGINPLLLDRDGFWQEVNDCPRIRSLAEIVSHL
jgi:putative hydrolase of the HAD superfamily